VAAVAGPDPTARPAPAVPATDVGVAAQDLRPHGLAAVQLVAREALAEAWRHRILGLSAEAGFWQLLSLPPLLITVLGVVGFFAPDLGPHTVSRLLSALEHGAGRFISPSAVNTLVKPSLRSILTHGRADVVSLGFALSFWSGSSATATFVNTITIAYRMRDLRSAVRSRLLALMLYLGGALVGITVLPALVLGPTAILDLLPHGYRPAVHTLISVLYWPTIAVASILVVATLYHLSVPVRTRWRRDLPGAVVAMALWLLSSYVLRLYITLVFLHHKSSYGALASPVAVLLFFYLTALAVLLGAEVNAEIDRVWPTPETSRARHRSAVLRRERTPPNG
jgi:membrane protein